jgi:hypothetical protein
VFRVVIYLKQSLYPKIPKRNRERSSKNAARGQGGNPACLSANDTANIEKNLLGEGRLDPTQIENRELPRHIMREAGFFGIENEWWHFNRLPEDVAKRKCTIIG